MASEEKMNLEKSIEELNDIISQMEDPEVSLEDAFNLYKSGVKKLKSCTEFIDSIEKELIELEEE